MSICTSQETNLFYTRRSVPIFWRQRGITAQTKITRSFEFTNNAYVKHFEDIKKNYAYVLCINLMKKSKQSEQMITEGFETHMRKNNLGKLDTLTTCLLLTHLCLFVRLRAVQVLRLPHSVQGPEV